MITRQAQHAQQTTYKRRSKTGLTRDEYVLRAKEFALRGEQLPQTKLTADDVRRIRQAKQKRLHLMKLINERYSNATLAEIFGVSVRCIESVTGFERHAP